MEEEFNVLGKTYRVVYTYRYNPHLMEDELTIETINNCKLNEVSIDDYIISAIEDAILKYRDEKAEDESLGL